MWLQQPLTARKKTLQRWWEKGRVPREFQACGTGYHMCHCVYPHISCLYSGAGTALTQLPSKMGCWERELIHLGVQNSPQTCPFIIHCLCSIIPDTKGFAKSPGSDWTQGPNGGGSSPFPTIKANTYTSPPSSSALGLPT